MTLDETGMLYYAHMTMVLKPLWTPALYLFDRLWVTRLCCFIAAIETRAMLCNKYDGLYSHCTSTP